MLLKEPLSAGEVSALLAIVGGGILVIFGANVPSDGLFWIGVGIAVAGWLLQGVFSFRKHR